MFYQRNSLNIKLEPNITRTIYQKIFHTAETFIVKK